MAGTQVVVIPQDMQLPDYLRTPEMAKQIAEQNAAAAGGIKIGGYPRISIKGGKFHIVDGGETTTIMQPGTNLPMMQLEAVIVAANAGISKTYYPGKYKDGDDGEPACSSDNGVVPDSHIFAPQSATCTTCPQNQWGSKISESSGKEVKACADNKRLAIIPAQDLGYKALGLAVTPAALTAWGQYVKALTERNIPVNAVVTRITFDHTAAFPKLQFAFGRMLTAEEFAKVQERARGSDVKDIISPARQLAPAAPALPAPTTAAAVPAQPVSPAAPEAAAGSTPPAATPTTGFGAAAPETTTRGRGRPRKPATPEVQAAAATAVAQTTAQVEGTVAAVQQATLQTATDPLAHLPPAIKAALEAVGGANTPAGQAILVQYPKPASAAAPVQPAPQEASGAAASSFGEPPPAVVVGQANTALRDQLAAKLAALNGTVKH